MSLHMSLFMMIMMAGWITTLAMIGFFALEESGKLIKIRQRVALWLESSASPVIATPEESLEPGSDEAARSAHCWHRVKGLYCRHLFAAAIFHPLKCATR
jgi:hypothetical protein